MLKIFFELTSSRSIGMSVGPIPWYVIEAYCLSHGLDLATRKLVHHCITILDAAYLGHIRKSNA